MHTPVVRHTTKPVSLDCKTFTLALEGTTVVMLGLVESDMPSTSFLIESMRRLDRSP
jgi:hypothetical protein